ncbi:MAG: sulfite exporter TauE/SafE family protein, partial [Porticoccaceae bacterium]
GIGAVAGLVAGVFGLGGGAVVVPVLIFAFQWQGMAPEVLTHMAIGTSLATIVVTAMSAIRTHQRRGAIRWRLVAQLVPGVLVGTMLGGLVAARLKGELLQFGFGAFLLLVAFQMAFGVRVQAREGQPPGRALQTGAGATIGFASGIFGIGGGSLTVPYLSWCREPMVIAVATSSALGLPIALSGAATYVFGGHGDLALPEWSWGFVYLPALLGIVATSTPFARWGARLAHRLPERILRRSFALVSLLIGVQFMVRNLPFGAGRSWF